ncbi:hypothetical protein MMC18_007986 [Xylographa bjoerkii]|nr:hypothetical protein [Xylographa bjoerkii]
MDSLPVELLCGIIGLIKDQRDLRSLCQVSKGLNTWATPFLYHSVTLTAAESDLGYLHVKAFSEGLLAPESRLRHVKHLHIVAPFRERLECRCIHWYGHFEEDDSENGENKENQNGNNEIRPKNPKKSDHYDLEDSLMSVLQQLKENSLLSFSWDLGICIPSTLLGEKGILTKTQRHIESLSLTTGGVDEQNIEGSYLPALLQLKCLRSLSWKAIKTVEELYALRHGLWYNSQHLLNLEVDLVDYPAVYNNWCAENPGFPYRGTWQKPFGDNFFATNVLGLMPGKPIIMFPALQALRFSVVPFSCAIMEMAYALNLTNLRTLKLHNCLDSLKLLDFVTKALQPIRLTSFELVTDIYDQALVRISNFLETFTGLEELFLLFFRFKCHYEEDYWPSIRYHKSSLKRLVYHKETYRTDHKSVLSRYTTQKGSTCGSANDATIGLPLVDCIGISDDGFALKSKLEPIAPTLKWKLLHVRWTAASRPNWCDWAGNDTTSEPLARHAVAGGSYASWRPMSQYVPGDLHTFATWAFGPAGLPKLQILASGDFSHKGRFDERNVLLCRRLLPVSDIDSDSEAEDETKPDTTLNNKKTSPPRRPYRRMRKEDWGLWDGIEGGFAMLEACPVEPLIRK